MRLIHRINGRRQYGLSLVELMVGITVGLIITAAASMVAVNQINEHRRLMLETQVQQDLRTVLDLIHQDIRRIGYRGYTGLGVWAPANEVGSALEVAAQPAKANAYTGITIGDHGESIEYTYSHSIYGRPNDNPEGNDNFGVKFDDNAKVLYMKVGETNGNKNWQPLTDPDIIKITGFNVSMDRQSVLLDDFCDKRCTGTCTKPRQVIRRLQITVAGYAAHDPAVRRTLSISEKLRADAIVGSCPA